MAIYNAKKLTITKGEDTYIIDPLQGNESVYVDLVANIAKNAWTQGQSYTYRFTDSHITANAGIMVGFKENIREGLVGDLKYTKGTGYVDFETNEMPIGPISVLVRVIDSATNGVYPIDAAIVETDAIIGETTVQGALEDLDERATSISQNMAKHASLADEYDDTDTYAVGDLCIYENELYKCSTAISTAEDWTASHWTATTLDAELAARDTSISTNATNIGKLKADIGIVEDGNICTHSGGIAKGQYVIWKGNLYTADAAISVGETFYSSGGSKNLTAKTEGAANELNSKIATQSNTITFTNLPSNVASASCSYCKNGFLAQVDVSFSLNSGSTTDWIILGSVPVKPKYYITKDVVPDVNNASIPQARVRITGTGELRVFYGGPGNYYCSFVFFC